MQIALSLSRQPNRLLIRAIGTHNILAVKAPEVEYSFFRIAGGTEDPMRLSSRRLKV